MKLRVLKKYSKGKNELISKIEISLKEERCLPSLVEVYWYYWVYSLW